MVLAVPTLSKDLGLVADASALIAPQPTPTSAPAYVPPTNPTIAPTPVSAPSPDGQTMGRGGTSFGLVPNIYILPPPPVYDTLEAGYDVLPERPPEPVPGQPVRPPRPGENAVMPVPEGQQPVKVPVKPVVASVDSPPGPISGTVAGYDLARVPLWAWLVGAAVIGSKVLR